MKDIESFQDDNRNSDVVAIEINNLTKRFGNFTAIDGLTLTVKYGEIFGLLGPNGSGKTTTINIVSGLSKPTYGQVIVLGHDIMKNTRSYMQLLELCPKRQLCMRNLVLGQICQSTLIFIGWGALIVTSVSQRCLI